MFSSLSRLSSSLVPRLTRCRGELTALGPSQFLGCHQIPSGNKKLGASAGSVPEMKGGAKLSRYAAEATAEHVGRMSRNFGLKSVVMKVKGFTYFKKKKQAILSWKDGFTNSKVGQNPVIYIEDTTRKPHNGCRLRKKRRV
ncbi:hypothetical protein M0R45_025376 [Rubus argutus]|uniref:Ribosomal protein S11 n=1 Tax=Rubus argutus TaxID=59490 RepID=A0AAW1WY14_RUBAR